MSDKNLFYWANINIHSITQDVFLMLEVKGSSRAVEGHGAETMILAAPIFSHVSDKFRLSPCCTSEGDAKVLL